MAVRDGRPFRRTFELDVHGFVLVDHPTQVKDFLDERERTNIYVRELQELVQRHSSASEVLVYDHTVRTSDQHSQRDAGVRRAVKRVHNDYTELSARKRLRSTVGFADAERWLQRRWAIIQVWRPISSPVLVAPIGICDGRSVRRQNLVRVERRYRDRTGENYQVSYDPAHQWFYFPQMVRHEALLFKTFDSDLGVPSRFTPHSAFDVPGTPAGAPARESIESRAFAFFD